MLSKYLIILALMLSRHTSWRTNVCCHRGSVLDGITLKAIKREAVVAWNDSEIASIRMPFKWASALSISSERLQIYYPHKRAEPIMKHVASPSSAAYEILTCNLYSIPTRIKTRRSWQDDCAGIVGGKMSISGKYRLIFCRKYCHCPIFKVANSIELVTIPIVISQSTSIGDGNVLHCAHRSLLVWEFHHKPIAHMHWFSELYATSKVSESIVIERITAFALEN